MRYYRKSSSRRGKAARQSQRTRAFIERSPVGQSPVPAASHLTRRLLRAACYLAVVSRVRCRGQFSRLPMLPDELEPRAAEDHVLDLRQIMAGRDNEDSAVASCLFVG